MIDLQKISRQTILTYTEFTGHKDPGGAVPIGEAIFALNKLKEDGKIRAISVSNLSTTLFVILASL